MIVYVFYHFCPQPLYAGVVSLCEDTEFTITFHRKDTLAAAKGRSKINNEWEFYG